MKTKEQIIDSALTLFAQKGYDGTSLQDIADSIGFTKAALYRHFHGKEDLWDKTVEAVTAYYTDRIGLERRSGTLPSSAEELKQMSLEQIDFTLHDVTVIRMRKIITTSQYRDVKTAELATSHFYTTLQTFYAELFSKMISAGILHGESEQMAFEYTAPITVLINVCDREPDREKECLHMAENHIDYFLQRHAHDTK